MKEETPKCNSCGQLMFEIGGIGKNEQIQEVWNDEYRTIGIREKILYQCPECKDVKIY